MADDPTLPRPAKKPLLPRWLKFLLILVGTFFVLAAGAWVLLDIVTRQDLEATLAEIRALGWPTELEELYPEPIPDEENAALVYDQAWVLDQPQTEVVSRVEDVEAWRTLTEAEQTHVREALDNVSQVLALLHQAAQMEQCQFDLEYGEGYAMLLPHVAKMRNVVRWKRVATIVALVDGRTDEAVEHWLDSLAMVRHQEGQKVFISELARLACLSISLDTLQAMVQERKLDQSHVSRGLDTLAGMEARDSFAEGYRSEITFGFHLMDLSYEQIRESLGGECASPELSLLLRLYCSPLGRPWRQYDQWTRLCIHREAIQLGEQPYCQIHQQLQQLEPKLPHTGECWAQPLMTPMLLPALGRRWQVVARAEARVALARTALALERYRLLHGEYPKSVAHLTPDILPHVPVDPFDGQPLRYVNSDERVAVYSIGEDLQDDGGSEEGGVWGRPQDIVFTLRRAPRPTEE